MTGILVQGSNGEAQLLSRDERKQAISLTRRTLDENGYNSILVIAGTGAQSTRETKQLCKDAFEAGASHALVLTPSTWPKYMSTENILRFHRDVADASPIPTMIYNFPTVTAGQDLDSDVISALAAHPNIVGTKLSCGNIGKLHRLASKWDAAEFAVFAGRSDLLVHGLLSGSSGAIAALVNILPKLHVRLYSLWKEGHLQEAMGLQTELGHADWAISKIGGIGGVKAIVSKHWSYGGFTVRGPLKPVNIDGFSGNNHLEVLEKLIESEKALML